MFVQQFMFSDNKESSKLALIKEIFEDKQVIFPELDYNFFLLLHWEISSRITLEYILDFYWMLILFKGLFTNMQFE